MGMLMFGKESRDSKVDQLMPTNSSRLAVIRGCRGLDVGSTVEEVTDYDTTGNTVLAAANLLFNGRLYG